jgi:hypothetical protein
MYIQIYEKDFKGLKMLPILIFAGTAISALSLAFKRTCSHCGKYFVWNEQCDLCEKETCDACGIRLEPVAHRGIHVHNGGWFCSRHNSYVKEAKNNIQSEIELIDKAKLVTHTTINYHGNSKPSKLKKAIKGDGFHQEKELAIFELQKTAVIHGCNHIAKLDFEKGGSSNGNYQFSTWRAKGEI